MNEEAVAEGANRSIAGRAAKTAVQHFLPTPKVSCKGLVPNSIHALEAGVHDHVRYDNHERIMLGLQGAQSSGVPNERHRLIGGVVTLQLQGGSSMPGRCYSRIHDK